MNSTSSVTRRQFLRQTTTVLGAALAVPSLVPASALGRSGAMPPSERITMGFIGVGGQGGGHLLGGAWTYVARSEEHTSELQSLRHLVCRLLLEKKHKNELILTGNAPSYSRNQRTVAHWHQ